MWKINAYLRQLSAMAVIPLSLTLVQLQSSEVMLRHLAAAWRSMLSPVNWPRLQPEIFSSWRNPKIDLSMLHTCMQLVTMAWIWPCDSMWFNSTLPSATYIRQWTRSALVQVMAWCLFSAKSLPEPILTYCELDSCEQISVKFKSKIISFSLKKCTWNGCLPKWGPFCPDGDELINSARHTTRQGTQLNRVLSKLGQEKLGQDYITISFVCVMSQCHNGLIYRKQKG